MNGHHSLLVTLRSTKNVFRYYIIRRAKMFDHHNIMQHNNLTRITHFWEFPSRYLSDRISKINLKGRNIFEGT